MNELEEELAEAPAAEASAPVVRSVPRVRTLLVCDLADSTALVERLGDSAAAELIRRHDRIARELLHRHGGREIDKTDGFLALFQRPVEALAFALEYQRALRTLGDERRQPLRARVGVHIGEVVVWENAADDIAGGAKPVDVEGLAKPVAARLMALALPGQILLSGIAFSLAQRAASELPAARELRWLTHGRYRFKGVPAPMLVHEVGESGFAPLHAPPSTTKAERDLPLWRRPGVLALEAIALIAAIAVPLGLSLRAPPAIAFGERDWVVVGDLRNLTGEATLDQSLETAFRISLEQSRYVNVLPDLKLRDTLARMQRPADVVIDRSVASEIALREGARAVILPTVAEIGGRVRVSAEVVDPTTQTTVYAESADGVGAVSALESIDTVTQELRARLGEALQAIDDNSAPLPKVTSRNLDALRAYALGLGAWSRSEYPDAIRLFDLALAQDPAFALAHIGKARALYASGELAAAQQEAERAYALRERLTTRDAMYVDAWKSVFGPTEAKMDKWWLLAEIYPDTFAAHYNYAMFAGLEAGLYERALEALEGADVSQNPDRGESLYLRGLLQLALDRVDAALESFAQAVAQGSNGSLRAYAFAHAVKRDYAGAERVLAQSLPVPGARSSRPDETRLALLLDAGDFARLDEWRRDYRDTLHDDPLANDALTALFLDAWMGDAADLGARLERAAQAAAAQPAGNHDERDRRTVRLLLLAGLAARAGVPTAARRALQEAEPLATASGIPLYEKYLAAAHAELLRIEGKADEGLALLAPRLDGSEPFVLHSVRLRLLRDLGRHAEAAAEAEWLRNHRGRAFSTENSFRQLRLLDVADANVAMLHEAEALAALGDTGEANARLQAFLGHWPEARRIEVLRVLVERLAPAQPRTTQPGQAAATP